MLYEIRYNIILQYMVTVALVVITSYMSGFNKILRGNYMHQQFCYMMRTLHLAKIHQNTTIHILS